MAKWIAAEKVRGGLQHVVVWPNVTGSTKERIAQSKRVRVGSLAMYICMVIHIARVWINRVRLPILLVVS